jgi:phage terminase large subunit-like protein
MAAARKTTKKAEAPLPSPRKRAPARPKPPRPSPVGMVQSIVNRLQIPTPEGMNVGKPLVLLPFQEEIVAATLFNPVCRRGILSFARKNGKTTLAALIGVLGCLGFRVKANSLIAVAARSRDQASILFDAAARMVQMSPVLSTMFVVKETRKELICLKTNITLRAVSAEATTAYGLSPAMVVHDELGQVRGPQDALYDALETAMGAHAEPLSIIISTQAASDDALLSVLIDSAKAADDPRTQLFLHAADPDDDIHDPSAWYKANPALGVFRNDAEFKEAAERARKMPSFESAFRNYYLNMRVSGANSLVTADVWRANGAEPDPAMLDDCELAMALDLSAKQDLTAAVIAAEAPDGVTHLFAHFWTPEATLKEREERDRAPYSLWVRQGFMTATPGTAVRLDFVARWIGDICQQHNVVSLRYDRWRMPELMLELERLGLAGLPLEPFGQGYKDMAPAVDRVESLLVDNRVRHGMHPVLTWNMANAIITRDPAGNRKLDKSRAVGRIDGAVAMVMALARSVSNPGGAGEPPIFVFGS